MQDRVDYSSRPDIFINPLLFGEAFFVATFFPPVQDFSTQKGLPS